MSESGENVGDGTEVLLYAGKELLCFGFSVFDGDWFNVSHGDSS
jgi:hypothetical protein